jgi:hypothetical protein
MKSPTIKNKIAFSNLLVLTLLLTFGQMAHASSLWYVNGVHGNDLNNCKTPVTACKTIGHGISLASSGDAILVAAAVYPENGLSLSVNLTIVGSGASVTIIDGGLANRVMTINGGVHASVIGLTIQNGAAPGCGLPHPGMGGGILSYGTLTVSNAIIANNRADFGGGIYSGGGTLAINNSTISGNHSCPSLQPVGYGGGIYSGGTLTINNSTLNDNSVRSGGQGAGQGGGILVESGSASLNNITVSNNNADGGDGGILLYSGTASLNNSTVSNNNGWGLAGAVTVKNSIVANNRGNCKSHVTSSGYNLSSDNTCNFHQAGDLNNTNPLLGPLQNNGGPTQTQALLDGSPAIDAGNPGGCTDGSGHLLTTDQRGMPRPDPEDLGGCDMGAYERQTD